MAVKISAGWLKGSVLKTPVGTATRPTASRVREAVMDMLQGRLEGASLLELFAGSGAFSLEALSRGARKAVLVESDRAALGALRSNLALVEGRAAKQGIPVPQTVLLGADVAGSWKQIARHAPFQLVWVDPPYGEVVRWLGPLMTQLPPLLAQEGIFILESDRSAQDSISDALTQGQHSWQLLKTKRYGDTYITMMTHLSREQEHDAKQAGNLSGDL